MRTPDTSTDFVKAKIVNAKVHNLKGSIIQAETMIKFTSQIVWCTHIPKYKQMELSKEREKDYNTYKWGAYIELPCDYCTMLTFMVCYHVCACM